MTDERPVTMTKPGVVHQLRGRGSRREAILTMATTHAPSRIPDQPCADCLDHSLVAERRRLAVPRQVAFWLLAFVLTATMLGTTLPTPLYVIYQAQWHSPRPSWR